MNNNLAPTYQIRYGADWVLWYVKSNNYSIVEPLFKKLLYYYLQAENLDAFKAILTDNYDDLNAEDVANTFRNYLSDSNRIPDSLEIKQNSLDTSNRNISKEYTINGKTIMIHYDSDLVLRTIHPALAHHHTVTNNNVNTTFDIFLQNENLYLFKDGYLITYAPKRDYHLIQGKFIMHLLCAIHNKTETDWIGTFHGSTITDGKSSILFVGESGKGKSTLCALLSASGFGLVADDVSPMLSKNKNIYYNPSAISIKEGAFEVLQPIVQNFDTLPTIQFNKTKGPLKYVPYDSPKRQHFPCSAIVLVNYRNKGETLLENVSIKTILETIIPESWLSPDPLHAKQFLDWLETISFYKLTYSDTKSVIAKVSELFKNLNENI